MNLGVYCALAGMLGAKILMIVMDPEYRAHPSEIFSLAVLQSAGIFFGGFILALVFAYFYMRAQGLPVLATSDIFAPGLALGHGIGRLGCFAAGCCWGKPTHLPWAVTFTNTNATTGVPLGIPLHPTQLYEAFAEGIICLILIRQLNKAASRRSDHRTIRAALRVRSVWSGVPARARLVEPAGRSVYARAVDLPGARRRGRVPAYPSRARCDRDGSGYRLI